MGTNEARSAVPKWLVEQSKICIDLKKLSKKQIWLLEKIKSLEKEKQILSSMVSLYEQNNRPY